MPTITVKYTDTTSVTLVGTTIAIVAVPGSEYRHNDKALDSIAFKLDTANSGTVSVSPSTGSMPQQTCFAGAAPALGLPLTIDWIQGSAGAGVLTVTIPSTSSATYLARLQVLGGGKVNLSAKH